MTPRNPVCVLTLFLLYSAFAHCAVEMEIGRNDGALYKVTVGGRQIIYEMGMTIQGRDFLIPQNRYNTSHFRNVSVEEHGKNNYFITGELTEKIDFVERIQTRDNTISIEYTLIPRKDMEVSARISGGLSIAKPYSETTCFGDGKNVNFADETGETTGIGGKDVIGWKYADGMTVRISPIHYTIATMNIQDKRKWGGFSFVFNAFSAETDWKLKPLKQGQPVKFGIVITVEVPEEKKPDAGVTSNQPMAISIPFIEKPPVIDASTWPEWKKSLTRISNFSSHQTGLPSENRTDVYLGYDNENLYIGCAMFTPENYVPYDITPSSERDKQLWSEDSVEIFLPSRSDKSLYYQFIGNRLGAIFDSKDGDQKWNGEWTYRTKIFKDRWEAFAVIPFSTIDIRPEQGMRIPFQVARNQRTPGELSSWVPVVRMFAEGLANGNIVLGGNVFLQMNAVSPAEPAISGRIVTETENPVKALIELRTLAGKELKKMEEFFNPGDFSIAITGLAPGMPYVADVSLFHSKGTEKILVPFISEKQLKITVNPRILRNIMEFSLLYYGDTVPDKYLISFHPEGKEEDVKTIEAKGVRRLTETLSLGDFPPGRYTVRVKTYQQETPTGSYGESFEVLKLPEWYGNRLGVTDKVSKPWTPMEVKNNVVSCWGRKYVFGSLFPERIVTQDRELLSSPVYLEIFAGGTRHKFTGKEHPVFTSIGDSKIVVEGMNENADFRVRTRSTVEFDGLIKTALEIIPLKKATVEKLQLTIPLNKEYVQMRTQKAVWGATVEEYRDIMSGFSVEEGSVAEKTWKNSPDELWVGSEKAGFVWLTESSRNFSLRNPEDAVEVKHAGEKVLYTVTFINIPQVIDAPITYTFGMMATPSKPWPAEGYRGWNTVICTGDIWYPGVTSYPYNPEIMDRLKENCVKVIIDMGNWLTVHDSLMDYKSDWLKKWVEESHRRGIKVLAYIGHGVTTRTSEYNIMAEETLRNPMSLPFSMPNKPDMMTYRTCANSSYVDYVTWKIDWLMKKYGIDGIYLDEWGTEPCMNELHGCGYTDGTGKRRTAVPYFGFREEMKRVYNVVKTNNPDGIVYMHGRHTIPAMNFVDTYFTGEQFIPIRQETRPPLLQMLPLSYFRSDFSGIPFGVPGGLYTYHGLPWKNHEAIAMAFLHNTPTIQSALYGADRMKWLEETASVWKILDRFGAHASQFSGYWEQRSILAENPEVKVSFWKNKDDKILVFAATFGENRETTLKLNTGFVKSVSDAVTGENMRVRNNGFEAAVNKDNFRMFIIETEKK